jgi:hypothetical protein
VTACGILILKGDNIFHYGIFCCDGVHLQMQYVFNLPFCFLLSVLFLAVRILNIVHRRVLNKRLDGG